MIHVKHLKRRRLFALVDALGVIFSILLAFYLRTEINIPVFTALLSMQTAQAYALNAFYISLLILLFGASQYFLGVYDMWYSNTFIGWAQRLLFPNISVIIGIIFIFYVFQIFDYPRSILFVFFIFNYLISVTWRYYYFRQADKEISDVVLIGDIGDGLRLAREFALPPYKSRVNANALFCSKPLEELDDSSLETARLCGLKVYPLKEFSTYSEHFPYTSVIFVPAQESIHSFIHDVLQVVRDGVPVYTMPSIYEVLLGRLKHIQVNDLPLLELNLDPLNNWYANLKRIFEVLLSLCLLILLSPLFLAIGIFIKMNSPGPIFFSQERVGLNGKLFKIYKFRSMFKDSDKNFGVAQARKNDPRITSWGKFLRKTRFDELPQLINILKGDMSFVGPRPFVEQEVKEFEDSIPAFRERTRIRPGITGLAQVSGTYESSPETKLKYDLAYLSNQSLSLDIQILIKTAKHVFLRSGQ